MTSTETDARPVKFLVVDSSALIRRAPIKELADIAYSTEGVVSEIRDAATRATLQILPFEFKLKEPSSDAIRFVTGFARKTGDFSNLSAVDLHLLALAYQLCKENLSPEEFSMLKTEPVKGQLRSEAMLAQLKAESKTVNVAGFYMPKKGEDDDEENKVSEKLEATLQLKDENNNAAAAETGEQQHEEANDGDEEENESQQSSDEDDEEGWIKPSNIAEVKKKSLVDADFQELTNLSFQVACMTADFAMQNVLIQIGIPILSVDGLLIKKPRSYVLKCIACSKLTTNMTKQFCPHCGYKTLERQVVTVDSDGNKIYKGRRKPRTAKGTRFSLPMPKGGKHSNNPILSEDQPRPQNLPSKKSLIKNNPLDPDYVCQSSPFAVRDVYSRAASLGIKPSSVRFNKRC